MLLTLAFPLCASAGTAAQTTITATTKAKQLLYSGHETDAFRVAIDLSLGKEEPGISVYIVTVRWDPNILELVTAPDSYEGTGCYFTDAFSEGWKMVPNGTSTLVNTADAAKGKLTVVSAGEKNRALSDGTLFVLQFRPKKGGLNLTTEITVTPGSSHVAPSAALSSETGRITNVAAETKLSLTLNASQAQRGDVNLNGSIDALDYLQLKRHVNRTFTLSASQQLVADINRDGKINALDYLQLKRHVNRTYVIS